MKAVPTSRPFRFTIVPPRHMPQWILSLLLLALPIPPASARTLDWEGTLRLDLGNYPPLTFAGSGVATIAGPSGGSQLENLRIAGGISGVGTIPITDPFITASYRSLRISPQLGTGTLGPFWPVEPWPEPQLSRKTLPIRGSLRMCMFFSGCIAGSTTPLSRSSGAEAVGVGGRMTAGGFGATRISIEAAPWTVYSTTLRVDTVHGATADWIRSGWIHGPASSSSSAATPGGALQLVTPLVVRSNSGLVLPGFTSLTLRFVPEPGSTPLLAAGILTLAAIRRAAHARSRIAERGNLHEIQDSRTTPR